MKNKKLYIVILILAVSVILGIFFYNIIKYSGFNTQKHEVQFIVKTFFGEKATYKIFNNSPEVIGIWPDTCASETIRLQKKNDSGSWSLYQPKTVICELMPSVIKLNPGEIRTFTKSLKGISLDKGLYRYELTFGSVTNGGQLTNVRKSYSAEQTVKFIY